MALTARSQPPGPGWMRPARAYQPATATFPSRRWARAARSGLDLAQVVAQRPHLLGVAFAQGGEGAAGADGVELAVIADEIVAVFGPGPLHRPEQPGQVDIGGHPGLITNQDMAVGEGQDMAVERTGDGRSGLPYSPPSQSLARRWRMAKQPISPAVSNPARTAERVVVLPDPAMPTTTSRRTVGHQPQSDVRRLGVGQPTAQPILESLDGVTGDAPVHPGPGPTGHGVGQPGDAGLVGEHAAAHTASLAPTTAGRRMAWVLAEYCVDGLVEDRDGQAVQMGGDGHDHVTAAEGLL